MRTCTNVIIHAFGIPLIIGVTAYFAMSEDARRKVNKKVADVMKSEKRMLEECCDDCCY